MNDNEKLIEQARNWGQSDILSAPVTTEALMKNLVLALRAVSNAAAAEPTWEARTDRGFGYTLIRVSNYRGEAPVDFSVQMSSLATEAKVWIGTDGHRAHMNVEEATRTRDALNAFLAAVKHEGAGE